MDELAGLLTNAGLIRSGELWTDAEDRVAVVESPYGVFVGRLDVAWPGGGEPEARFGDVEHLPPTQVARLLPLALHRARAAWAAAAGTCRVCGETFSPGHMHAADVCRGCAGNEA